jgi:hypothetical protein
MVSCVRGLGGGVGELCEPDEQGGVPAPREDQRAAGPPVRGPAPGAGGPQARLAPPHSFSHISLISFLF